MKEQFQKKFQKKIEMLFFYVKQESHIKRLHKLSVKYSDFQLNNFCTGGYQQRPSCAGTCI